MEVHGGEGGSPETVGVGAVAAANFADLSSTQQSR
jgi:hypothetical protein